MVEVVAERELVIGNAYFKRKNFYKYKWAVRSQGINHYVIVSSVFTENGRRKYINLSNHY